jgi:preprotein translocase subunit YajC
VFYAANSSGGGSYTLLLMMAVLFGAMYFLMIRPQQRRRREQQALQSSIGPGDEVMTIGGLYGTVVDVDDESITLEVAPGITNRYTRGAVNRVVTSASQPAEEDEAVEDDLEPPTGKAKTADEIVERE